MLKIFEWGTNWEILHEQFGNTKAIFTRITYDYCQRYSSNAKSLKVTNKERISNNLKFKLNLTTK